MKLRGIFAGAVFLAIPLAGSAPARAANVDLALVLAIDVSSSVNEERFQLQTRGYAAAFRNPLVADAIAQGPEGAIAVTYVHWAGYGQFQQVLDWTVLSERADVERFGSAIAETSRTLTGSTSVSGAIDFSARLLRNAGHNARRQVIDISGDGMNNQGRLASTARDQAVAAGITINGLPILTEEPALDTYYQDHVIGGPGAFLVVAEDFESFAAAILNKLLTEIAGDRWAPDTVLPVSSAYD
jgi:hypothetical protein